MTAPDAIHELVAKFAQHRKEYQAHKNETELRREFLDPFFEALGWDVFKGMLSWQVAATDESIDRLVYELYGLTEEEIRIVEGVG